MINIKLCIAKKLFATLVAITCMLSTSACAQLTFTAEAITGKVVDEETGQPLAGVIIVAQWTVEESLVGRGNDLLNILETVTDKDGNYGFPAWGPKVLPHFPLSPLAIFGRGNDPLVVYFKSGYWPTQEKNELSDPEQIANRKPPLGSFQANGKTVKLRKWDGKDVKKYSFLVSSMSGNFVHERGVWRNYPRMVLTLIREQEKLKKLGNQFGLSGVYPEYLEPENLEFLRKVEQ